MTDCILTMKSATEAERARRTAAEMRIAAWTVSLDPSVTRAGCAFGLRFPCGDADRLRAALRGRGISWGTMIGGRG